MGTSTSRAGPTLEMKIRLNLVCVLRARPGRRYRAVLRPCKALAPKATRSCFNAGFSGSPNGILTQAAAHRSIRVHKSAFTALTAIADYYLATTGTAPFTAAAIVVLENSI